MYLLDIAPIDEETLASAAEPAVLPIILIGAAVIAVTIVAVLLIVKAVKKKK